MVVWHGAGVGQREGQPVWRSRIQPHGRGQHGGADGKTRTAGIAALLPGSSAGVALGKLRLFL